jgi:hypothetical protein
MGEWRYSSVYFQTQHYMIVIDMKFNYFGALHFKRYSGEGQTQATYTDNREIILKCISGK